MKDFKLSKTDYIIFRDCGKNAWVKIHKPEVYKKYPLSAFEQSIIETGNMIDEFARKLFPGGALVSSRKDETYTNELVAKKAPVIYQPAFSTGRFRIACDMLVWNDARRVYDLYEVKSSSGGEDGGGRRDKDYVFDIAFQKLVLLEQKIPLGRTYLIRLNRDYTRQGELDIPSLFVTDDFTIEVDESLDEIRASMENAYEILASEKEPPGACSCIAKGRSAHCTTFEYSNPHVPEYSVHDIARIGMSKRKLAELVDSGIFHVKDVPDDIKLSEIQQKQVNVAQRGTPSIDGEGIAVFLATFKYPLSFIDYETYPSAIPRFDGYHPYNQIPFQFSLHIVEKPGTEAVHSEFLYTGKECPDESFAQALLAQVPKSGSVLVWNQKFEKGINSQVAERLPEYKTFMERLNSRVIDLIDPFAGKNQTFVHPDFRGSASIKAVLPVLAPHLSYKKLHIQEGGTASNTWNEIVTDVYDAEERDMKIKALKEYCHLDTLAMVEVWKYLDRLTNS